MPYKLDDLSFRVLFCDDIRREDNGKYLLIGMYPSDLLLDIPGTVALSLLITMDGLDEGKHRLDLKFVGPLKDGKTPTIVGQIDVTDSKQPATVSVPKIPLEIVESGDLLLFAVDEENQQKEIGVLRISQSPKQ